MAPIGVGYNVYNQLTLLVMNHGYNLTVSPFNTFQVRFKEFGDVGLSSALKVYKVFTKVRRGPWLKRKLYLGPTGVINCSEFLSGAFGYNTHRILLKQA